VTIQSVLFDLDGTFADTAPDLHYALDQVLISRGRPAMPFEQLRPSVSHGSQAMLRVGFGMQPGDAGYDSVRRDFLDTYLANIARHTRLFEGMAQLLSEFEALGVRWGIVTNKPAWLTDPLMQALGLAQRAACIVSGDTTAYAKPHPEPILHACRLMGATPERSIYVGDAKRDIEAGQRAGAKTLIALFGYLDVDDRPETWAADGVVSHPLEILQWLDHFKRDTAESAL
jgi:phosphoglycolate phosphatase